MRCSFASAEVPDNQQERPGFAGWIAGFTDGEGCFSVSIFRNRSSALGWQVFPEFVLTQGTSSRSALEEVKDFLGCGRIYVNRRHDNHREDLLRYCVRSQRDLRERIIPFFKVWPLRTRKQRDFELFCRVLEMMSSKEHLTENGLNRVRRVTSEMNQRRPR